MQKNVAIIDNYDSFTYNLVQLVERTNQLSPTILKNDEIDASSVSNFEYIIISPGPGLPDGFGQLMSVLKSCITKSKILGVCLGMQAIALIFGGRLKQLEQVQHGKKSMIFIDQAKSLLYDDLPKSIEIGRYHSWVVDENYLPENIIVDAIDEDGSIMSLYHLKLPIFGVQYHPESFMTNYGEKIIANFLNA